MSAPSPMSLRDRFAEDALHTLLAFDLSQPPAIRHGPQWVGSTAYDIADAMLAARCAPRVQPATPKPVEEPTT